jgi:hypothetical protein
MWNRPDVDFVRTQDLAWEHVLPAELGGARGGGLRKVLSADPDDGARTELLAFTNAQLGTLAPACDAFVISGTGRINGEPYRPGTYVHSTPGGALHWEPGPGPTVLYAGHFGTPSFESSDGPGQVTVKHETRDEWVAMGWRGEEAQPSDVRIRWLRQDDDGIVFLVGMLAGYTAPMEEVHPVYEESFKIAGDLMLGRRGVVKPGGYFFRSPETWHGPLYSRTGNLSIIRKNGFGSTDYRDPVAGTLDELIPSFYGSDPDSAPSLQGGAP